MVIDSTHDPMTKFCSFSTLADERILSQDKLCLVFRDVFPVSPGHTLIVPKRHIGSFFETSAAERSSLLHLLLKSKFKASGCLHNPGRFNRRHSATAAESNPAVRSCTFMKRVILIISPLTLLFAEKVSAGGTAIAKQVEQA